MKSILLRGRTTCIQCSLHWLLNHLRSGWSCYVILPFASSHPTFSSLICLSSHSSKGAKYALTDDPDISGVPAMICRTSGHGRLMPSESPFLKIRENVQQRTLNKLGEGFRAGLAFWRRDPPLVGGSQMQVYGWVRVSVNFSVLHSSALVKNDGVRKMGVRSSKAAWDSRDSLLNSSS